ncbi:hypothetical protein L7F22_002629 [Adiantum nelumboides]|nr:hypothetical protein [Adiantum nelumboides]
MGWCRQRLFSSGAHPLQIDILELQMVEREYAWSCVREGAVSSVADQSWKRVRILRVLGDVDETNKFDGENLVLAFYEALKKGKVEDISNLLTTQLSWRFYGPPSERHLIEYLSGVTNKVNFCFQVTYVNVINSNVVCIEGQALFGPDEGANSKHRRTWVHVWTLKGNKLVELREYFDAILTIVTLKPCACQKLCTLWQSKLSRVYEMSFPSLILII